MQFSRLPLTLLFVAIVLSLCSACDRPSCQTGFTYVAIPGYTATSNGCGSYGVSASAPFGVTPCCNQHDLCYHNCTATKSECDDRFDQCMKDVCDSENDLEKVACRAEAEAFYNAVMDLGCGAYESNQEDACQCQNGSIIATPSETSNSAAEPQAVSALFTFAAIANRLLM